MITMVMMISGGAFLVFSVRSDFLGLSVWWPGVCIGIALLAGALVSSITGVLP